MKTKKTIFTVLLLLGWFQYSISQDLLQILESEQQDTSGYIPATFKMTRIAFGHSTEVRSQGVLEVFVANRFWNLPKARTQKTFAIKLNSRIALEYGLSDRLTLGVGGSTFDALFDGYLKYKLLTQKQGIKKTPFNVTLFQNVNYYSNSGSVPLGAYGPSSNKLSFTSQMLISRKISKKFSFQISPTYIHKRFNFSEERDEDEDYSSSQEGKKDFFALGIGARYKIGTHLSLVSEYYKTFNPEESFDTYSPFALGVNWEIGDVLLQFMLTNTVSMVEGSFIAQTRNKFNFRDPNLNFGFNATYVIHFKNKLK
jgi:hypothetical protein